MSNLLEIENLESGFDTERGLVRQSTAVLRAGKRTHSGYRGRVGLRARR